MPEILMRSRYSAFCCGNIDYLLATLHSSQHVPNDREQISKTIHNTEWLSLRILHAPSSSATRGQVEFVAFYRNASTEEPPQQLHELSEFCFEQDRWWYTSGKILTPVKLGRNDNCWCGSGKKIKKCHP